MITPPDIWTPSIEKIDYREPKLIVRVKTSAYYDSKGIYWKKALTFLKRKSINVSDHMIFEDLQNVGTDVVMRSMITNMAEVKDGLYELRACNFSRDWETGYVDSWDYELVKYEEPSK